MSDHLPEVVLAWANGEYLFALRGAQIEALEHECINPETGKKGVGIAEIFGRVMGNRWYRSDVMNIIRLGLIGGGMGAVDAMRLVADYAETVPMSSLTPGFGKDSPLTVAQAVLTASMVGVKRSTSAGEPSTPER